MILQILYRPGVGSHLGGVGGHRLRETLQGRFERMGKGRELGKFRTGSLVNEGDNESNDLGSNAARDLMPRTVETIDQLLYHRGVGGHLGGVGGHRRREKLQGLYERIGEGERAWGILSTLVYVADNDGDGVGGNAAHPASNGAEKCN
ncbi:MAG: hypothetical protein Q9178_000038 [Gyalolechia marmorata]